MDFKLRPVDNINQMVNANGTLYCFAEKDFKKLCDILNSKKRDGIIIGALTVGMVTMGLKGYDMFKRFREKKYFGVLSNDVTNKEIVVFVRAKNVEEAEKKIEDIIKNELDNRCTFVEINEI